MGLLEESIKKEATKLASQYKTLNDSVNYNNNIKNEIGKKLIQLMVLNGIDRIDGVKVNKVNHVKNVTVEELKQLFNEESIADYIVVNVDLKATARNLSVNSGLNQDFVNKLLDVIKKLSYNETYELEVFER
jgi:hypothetical protein